MMSTPTERDMTTSTSSEADNGEEEGAVESNNNGAFSDEKQEKNESDSKGDYSTTDENVDKAVAFAGVASARSKVGNEKPPLTYREQVKQRWCPHGITKDSIPISLALLALVFTAVGSWDCSYFHGATITFTDNEYGLWTLKNMNGQCQLWDVLFFSYSIGAYLTIARALSMTAMVLGLSLVTAMSQALQSHLLSWAIGLTLFVLFIVSLTTTSQFNLWIVFFLFLYVILVLIVRALFIHPVHRVISSRGSKYIACLLLCNFVFTLLTLLVLKSSFCQCHHLSPERLEGRFDPEQDLCENQCALGPAGIVMVIGSGIWLLAGISVFLYGVQPEAFAGEYSDQFAGYSHDSITTRTVKATRKVTHHLTELRPAFSSSGNSAEKGETGNAESSELVEDGFDTSNNESQDMEVANVGSSSSLIQEDNEFRRSCRQKLCCDYRVSKRSRKEQLWFCCFRCSLGALIGIFLFIVVILSGSRKENLHAERSPSTAPNFITNVTCAFNSSNWTAPFVTYNSPEEALADNMTIAHCGACGFCSNMEDIETYVTTRETITIQAKTCGKTAVLGNPEELDACLKDKIGFTDDCRMCWVENMLCDTQKCLFTCMKTLFTGFLARNNVPESGDNGRLNWCLQCDEQRCGTAFATCSGVARRRLGIQSAIERNPDEICPYVDINWDTFQFQ